MFAIEGHLVFFRGLVLESQFSITFLRGALELLLPLPLLVK